MTTGRAMRPFAALLLGTVLALALAPGAGRAAEKFKLKEGARGKVCLDCHADLANRLKKPFVHTPVKDGDCTGCHNPHATEHGKLLATKATSVCNTCHDVVPAQARSTHKPVSAGRCTDCHDGHASDHKANTLKPERELCGTCHKELVEFAAKAKRKHSPLETDGCAACHAPHGSAKAGRLLKEDLPGLCTGCHRTDKPAFLKQHQQYPVGDARCTTCHNPHGSAKRGLLYEDVHAPVANRQCAQCHEDPKSPNRFRTKKEGNDLCKVCHARRMAEMQEKARVHRPVDDHGGCLSCHTPHASPRKGLLKDTQLAVCTGCHADTARRQTLSPTRHAPVRDGRCTTCHDPHAADAPLLFAKTEGGAQCGGCHDWTKHSSHPIGDKVKDPRNANLTLQCLSCHRAHGTEYKHLIPYPTTTELCTKCHVQFRR